MNPAARLTHMPQLDGLRAIAVSGVVLHHFGVDYFSTDHGSAAAAGVRLFFVLSGFLITGILLLAKEKVTQGVSSRSEALRNFYVRRVLRIFPLYYLAVLVIIAVNLGPAHDLAWWLLTHTLNLKMAAQGRYETAFAHFWSLNVEEQFYLVWPWIVLGLPARWLVPAAVAMISVTPLSKLAYVLSNYSFGTGLGTYIGTWACLDSLGIGALVAILRHRGSGLTAPDSRWTIACALAAAGAMVWFYFFHWVKAATVLEGTAQAVIFAWIILKAADGFRGFLGSALQWKPIAFIGKISYGIYVYHPALPGGLTYLLFNTGAAGLNTGWLGAAMAIVATLAVSSLSWFLLEKPINGLKERFR